MGEDFKKEIYGILRSHYKGYNVPFEQFEKEMRYGDNIKQVYESLQKKNVLSEDFAYEDFFGNMTKKNSNIDEPQKKRKINWKGETAINLEQQFLKRAEQLQKQADKFGRFDGEGFRFAIASNDLKMGAKGIKHMRNDDGFWGDLYEGMGDKFGDRDTKRLGFSDDQKAVYLLKIANKFKGDSNELKEGETLTEGEKAIIESLTNRSWVDENADYDIGYTIGSGAVASIPFMLSMVATGGIGRVATKGATTLVRKGLTNRLKSKATKKFGREISDEVAERVIKNSAKAKITEKGIGMTAGALTQTALMPSTHANIAENRAGNIYKGEDGSFNIDPESRMGHLESIYHGGVETFAEVLTERLGGEILVNPIKKGIGWGLTKTIGETGVKAVKELKPIQIAKGMLTGFDNKWIKATGFDGYLPEVAEEYIVAPLSDVLHGEFEQTKDLGKLRTHLEIWGTTALMSGAFASGKIGIEVNNYGKNYRRKRKQKRQINRKYKYNRNKLIQLGFTEENINDLDNHLETKSLEQISKGFEAIYKSQDKFTPTQKRALTEYTFSKLQKIGLDRGLQQIIDEQFEPQAKEIDKLTADNGQFIKAKMGNDREVFVVGVEKGIALNEDGTVDFEHSDESVVIIDKVGGDKTMVLTKDLFDVEIQNGNEFKIQMRTNLENFTKQQEQQEEEQEDRQEQQEEALQNGEQVVVNINDTQEKGTITNIEPDGKITVRFGSGTEGRTETFPANLLDRYKEETAENDKEVSQNTDADNKEEYQDEVDFDSKRSSKEKTSSATTRVTPDSNKESRAVAPEDASANKGNVNSEHTQELTPFEEYAKYSEIDEESARELMQEKANDVKKQITALNKQKSQTNNTDDKFNLIREIKQLQKTQEEYEAVAKDEQASERAETYKEKRKKALEVDSSQLPLRSLIAQYFLSGGRINAKEMQKELSLKRNNGQRKSMLMRLSNDAPTFDNLEESLLEHYNEEQAENIRQNGNQFRNEVLDVLESAGSNEEMADIVLDGLDTSFEDEQRLYVENLKHKFNVTKETLISQGYTEEKADAILRNENNTISKTESNTEENQGKEYFLDPNEETDAPFSKMTSETRAKQKIEEIQSKSSNPVQIEFVTTEQLPAYIKDHPNFGNNWDAVNGGKGLVYMNKEVVNTAERATQLWIHEVGVHDGIVLLIPDAKVRHALMAQVWESAKELAKTDQTYAEIVAHIEQNYVDEAHIRGDEVLAYLSEKIVSEKDLSQADKTLWQQILKSFRDVLTKLYGNGAKLLTDNEIKDIIFASVQSNFQNNELHTGKTRRGRGIRQNKRNNINGSEGYSSEKGKPNSMEYAEGNKTDIRQGRVLSALGNNGRERIVDNTDKKTNFVENEGNRKDNRAEARLDNRRAVENRALRELVGEPTQRGGTYSTIQASNSGGSESTILSIEEREELESRGINPDWNGKKFQQNLKAQAQANGVWLDKTYLSDKLLIHDQKANNTSENDVYLNADGKTITKVNNLAYVKSGDHAHNLSAFINRLYAHNKLFPNVAYKIKGFTENKNEQTSIVLEQPFVETQRNATQEEIRNFLQEQGFKQDGVREWSNAHEVWSNGEYELFDARPANVLVDDKGEFYFIDTYPHSVDYMGDSERVRLSKAPRSKDYATALEFANAQREWLEQKQSDKSVAVASAEREVNTNPTEGQKNAGNYKKGHVKVQGFDVTIEQPKGSVRSGVDDNGKEWSVEMQNTYGYFKGTKGKDGDHIDVFLGDNLDSEKVFVVDQVNDKGEFDEHKVMLGFNSEHEAKDAYLSNYSEGWQGLGTITETDLNTFKKWSLNGTKKQKGFAEYKEISDSEAEKPRFSKQKNADTEAIEQEMADIKAKAEKEGTFMKAPNDKPTNLNERQWLQVRTQNFKKWFGDWEKSARIEKLEEADNVVITEKDYKGKYELNRDSAKQYMKDNLRGTYTNKDTGNKVQMVRTGIDKVTSHDERNPAHLKSIVAIPQMLEDAIFIEEQKNQKGNNKFDSYQYYVVGLKIDNVDYTAKIVVGVKDGSRFYDHTLTQIEKGTLINDKSRIAKTEAIDKNTLSDYKDTKLLDILQTDSSKVVDENGEPLVVYHGTNNYGFYTFEIKNIGNYFTDKKTTAETYSKNNTIYGVYLNIKTPLKADFEGRKWNDYIDPEKALYGDYVVFDQYDEVIARFNNEAKAEQYVNENIDYDEDYILRIEHKDDISIFLDENNKNIQGESTESLSVKAKSLNKDGAFFKNVRDENEFSKQSDEESNVFVIFSPSQIKSATSNTGEFSGENDDIRFSKFMKGHYTEEQAKAKETEIKSYLEENLREGFHLDKITSSLTNGLSVYARVSYEGAKDKFKPFMFRISDHENGNARERIADMGTTWQVQGTDLSAMYAFYGLLTDKELREVDNERFVELHRKNVANLETKGITNSVSYKRSLEVLRKFEEAEDKSNIRFSKSLSEVNERFNEDLQRFAENGLLPHEVISLGRPLEILRLSGVANNPIRITQTVLKKHLDKHGLVVEDIKDLPKAINNPLMVYEWGTKAPSTIVITGLTTKDGRKITTAIKINREGKSSEISEIASVHGKSAERFLSDMNKAKKGGLKEALRWVSDEEKVLEWLNMVSPKETIQPSQRLNSNKSANSVQSTNLIGNGKNTTSIAKVIQNFENPKTEQEQMQSDFDEYVRFSKTAPVRPNEPKAKDYATAKDMADASREYLEDLKQFKKDNAKFQVEKQSKKEEYVESWFDAWRPVQLLQRDIEQAIGKKLSDHENGYIKENQRTSQGKNLIDEFKENNVNPLEKAIGNIIKQAKLEYKDVVLYMMAKHGIERNAYMKKHKGIENGSGIETAEAQKNVDAFEKKVGKDLRNELWKQINQATAFSLDLQADSGLISRSLYKHIKGMYQYYVPLRGWNEEVAEDVFSYHNAPTSKGAFQKMKKAEGRSSLADDPIPYIINMATSTVLQTGKNDVRLGLLNMVRNHKNKELYTVKQVWLVNTGTKENPNWVETNEKPDDKMFDDGKVVLKKTNNSVIGHKITPMQLRQHQVEVYENGEKLIIEFTDPAIARAIKGDNMFNADWLKWTRKATRFMSKNFTSRNPAFTLTNLARDVQYATLMNSVKHGTGTAFVSNLPKCSRALTSMIFQQEKYSPETKEVHKYLKEFLEIGGETGFLQMRDIESIRKEIQRDMRALRNPTLLNQSAKLGMNAIGLIEKGNRLAEDISRFATYYTLRTEKGMSMQQAGYEAKEITTNFNRHGTMSGFMGALFAFFNAAMQGVYNFSGVAKNHKGKMAGATFGFVALGFFAPALCRLLGGEDEDGNYYYDDIHEWERKSHLILPVWGALDKFGLETGGDRFVKIPLPHVIRAFYGWGESIDGYIAGKKTAGQTVRNMFSSLLDDISPVPVSGGGLRTLMPTAITPIYDNVVNKNFADYQIYKEPYPNEEGKRPQHTLAGWGTAQWLIDLSKWCNELGGGNDYRPASIRFKNGKYEENWVGHAFDWNPSKIEHVVEGYGGGMLTFMNNTYKFGRSLITGDELPDKNVPILRRFYTKAKPNSKASQYYKAKDENSYYQYFMGKDLKYDNMKEWTDKLRNTEDYSKMQLMKNFDSTLRKIKQYEEMAKGDKEVLQELKEQREKLYGDFLKQVDKLKEAS